MSKRVSAKTKAGSSSEPARPGWWRWLFRWLWILGAYAATLVFLLGLPVRLLGDSIDLFAPIFYATPWAVLMVCGWVAAWFWRGWRKLALGLAVAALLCAGGWVWTGFRFGSEGRGKANFRVAFWNCGHPDWRLRGILPMAVSWQADVACFAESREGALSPRWAEAFSTKRVQALGTEMVLAGPADLEIKSVGTLGGAGEFQLCRAVLAGREVFILLVDFDASPLKSRAPAFKRLTQLVTAYAEKPLIVLGDFNTPTESSYFKALRPWLTDAFDNAGSGLAATWPMAAPVLSLDHILVNKHLRLVGCEHHTSIYSDHRAVVVDLAWP